MPHTNNKDGKKKFPNSKSKPSGKQGSFKKKDNGKQGRDKNKVSERSDDNEEHLDSNSSLRSSCFALA